MTDGEGEGMASQWHLDKRVPIALIATIIMQSMAAVWWAASMQERLTAIERNLAAQSTIEGRLVRQEQLTEMQTRALERIERKLDRVIERERERP